ncbi:MAG: outer membrane protein assembly factor BamD [Alistipes sp.]|nr:outer membrane protein assembly factor BamD [Alistipes sp.]
MKNLLKYLAPVLLAAFFFGGCGVTRILRSDDPELIYSKALEFKDRQKWSRAVTMLESVEHYYVGSPREDSIMFYKAFCRYRDRDYDGASTILDEFRRKFGRSVFIEDAEVMYALCFYYMSPGPTRDQTMTTRALQALGEFIVRYPQSTHVESFGKVIDELKERLCEKAYNNAYTYYKIGRYKSAIIALRNAIREFPDSHRREELMYLIVKSSQKLADNSISEKQLDRYMALLDSYYSFIDEYPESSYRKELEKAVKVAKDFIDKNGADNRTDIQE